VSTVLLEPDAPVAADAAPPPYSRMAVAALALVGVVIAGYLLLYSVGVIETLACGAGACAAVQASRWATFAGLPVPLWGVGGYGAIFVLAVLGIQPGRLADRRIAAALLGLAAFAFAFSMYLTWVEAVLIRAWCRWCVASATVATLLFVAALFEAPRLRGGRT
jgi:uncharacterized membrane protein